MPVMPRIRLSDTLSLSRIAYGMWRLNEDRDTSPAHTVAKLETCLEQGLTTIDQADIYGGYTAEAILGEALKSAPGLRDRLEIVTKCGIVAPVGRHSGARVKHYDTGHRHIADSIDASLGALATDRIDLLLIHRPDPFMDPTDTGRALDDAIACGKVRHVGVSNFRPWDITLLQSHMHTPLLANQIELSLLARDAFTNGDLAFCQEHHMRPMAWSPLGGGALFAPGNRALLDRLTALGRSRDADPAAVAIAWLLAHPAGIVPVMGSNRPDRIRAFSAALSIDLDREDCYELYTLARGEDVP